MARKSEVEQVNPVQAFARRIVNSRRFEPFIIGLIIFNAVLIGLETSKEFIARYERLAEWGNDIIGIGSAMPP